MKRVLLIFEEGASFVNKTPFHVKDVAVSYLSSSSTFDLALFNRKKDNLGSIQLATTVKPLKNGSPEWQVEYQGEWGKTLFSNRLSLEIKQRF